MIRRAPMGYICRPLDYGIGSTEANNFIQCVDDQEPQIHELWCLVLDKIICEVHPTAQVEVTAGTVGEFETDYLAENGRRIQIIGQISVNDSVQFLGVPNQGGGSGLALICNLQAHVEATGWGSGNYSNQDWGGSIFDAHSMTDVAWGASVNPRLAYFPRSPVNPRVSQSRVHNKFLCRRHQERLWLH